jgi:hypothetical protein
MGDPWTSTRAHRRPRRSPRGIAYLAFDLRGVPEPVTSASLTLWCTNSASDGGTVRPVADASWIEGSRSGVDATSANGPGLKWIDVDTNGDGAVDGLDASPYVPDDAHPIAAGAVTSNRAVTVDLTTAFQQGARIYALAIRSASSDGATYSSREHPTATQRPRLHVTFAAP